MATTFDPFRDLDRMLGGALRSPASAGMPMDLYRTGETFVAKVDLPGVDPSTVDVDVEAQGQYRCSREGGCYGRQRSRREGGR